jgi:hypothetical protein
MIRAVWYHRMHISRPSGGLAFGVISDHPGSSWFAPAVDVPAAYCDLDNLADDISCSFSITSVKSSFPTRGKRKSKRSIPGD